MSDPVSNAEIEDVLSSIRRLVAGGKPEEAGVTDDTSSEHTNAAQPEPSSLEEALVLTPSLRVEETETMDAAEVSETPESEIWEEDDVLDREAPDSQSSDPVRALELEVRPEEELAFSPISSEKAEPIEEDNLELPTFIRSLDASTRPVKSPESAAAQPRNAENLGAEEPAQARTTPRAGFMFSPLDAQETETLSDKEEVEAEASVFDGVDVPDGAGLSNATPLTEQSRPSAPNAESQIGSASLIGDEAVPDFGDNEIIESDPWSGDFEEPVATLSETIEDDQFEAPENLFASGSAAVDEDALREMVTEMLHQELRGALGERITRNVRKLVRREIHRVLASRDFD